MVKVFRGLGCSVSAHFISFLRGINLKADFSDSKLSWRASGTSHICDHVRYIHSWCKVKATCSGGLCKNTGNQYLSYWGFFVEVIMWEQRLVIHCRALYSALRGSEMEAVALHLNVSSYFKTELAVDWTNCLIFENKAQLIRALVDGGFVCFQPVKSVNEKSAAEDNSLEISPCKF